MAFSWIFHANFEAGTNAEWDSESDTDGIIDFPHYSELARFPWSTCTPYSGAYCARIVPAGGTNDATLTEADINIANTVASHFHFNLWWGPDFDATVDDTFVLLELQETGSSPVAGEAPRQGATRCPKAGPSRRSFPWPRPRSPSGPRRRLSSSPKPNARPSRPRMRATWPGCSAPNARHETA